MPASSTGVTRCAVSLTSANGVTLPGATPSSLPQQLGAAEREARRAEPVGQKLQIDAAFLERDDEPQPALLVLQEQALAMTAGQAAAQRRRFGDRKDRRMRVGPVRDAQRVEPGKQLIRGQRACGGVGAMPERCGARVAIASGNADPANAARAPDYHCQPLRGHDIDPPRTRV